MGRRLGALTDAFDEALSRLDRGRVVNESAVSRRHGERAERLCELLELEARAARLVALDAALVGFRVVRELGRGGMGRVLLALDERGPKPRRVALKIVRPELARSDEARRRFLREGEAARRVSHENVVRLVEARIVETRAGGVPMLVMEYAPGRTLRRVLDVDGPMAEDACRHLGEGLARGLAAVHAAGVVHRDVKPSNVLVGRTGRVKLLDLGMSLLIDASSRLTRTAGFVGTLAYAAPEQFDATLGPVDARADLFSLGTTLFECLTGRTPWEVDATAPPGDVAVPGVSRDLADLLQRLLRARPEDRPSSADEVADAFAVRPRRPQRRTTARAAAPDRVDRASRELESHVRTAPAGAGLVLLVASRRPDFARRAVLACVGRLGDARREFRRSQPGRRRRRAAAAHPCQEALAVVETRDSATPYFTGIERCDLTDALERAALAALAASAASRPVVVLASVAPAAGRRLYAELSSLRSVRWVDLDRPTRSDREPPLSRDCA